MRSDDPLADAETFQLNSDQTVKLIGTRPESLEEIEGQYMGVLRFTHLGWKTFTNFTATVDPSKDKHDQCVEFDDFSGPCTNRRREIQWRLGRS